MVLHGFVSFALLAAIISSLALTSLALTWRSWSLLFVASLLSLAFSVAAIFSIGLLVVLLPCLQLAGAVALQRRASWHEWAALLFLAVLVWMIAIPGQLAVGLRVPLIALLPVALLGGAGSLAIGPLVRRRRARHRAGA